ncbi:MAG: hypothetical protein IH612_05010, partial [Desulfofustis sp.]|nr:hypothetical protein [Desulfofustis sp.]
VDGDGTLILSHGKLSGGSALTRAIAQRLHKPWLHIDCATVTPEEAVEQLRSWCVQHRIEVLNVAGPRASVDPLIYGTARQLIIALLLGQQRGPHGSV